MWQGTCPSSFLLRLPALTHNVHFSQLMSTVYAILPVILYWEARNDKDIYLTKVLTKRCRNVGLACLELWTSRFHIAVLQHMNEVGDAMTLYAHTGPSESLEQGQTLEDHLASVANRCAEFARGLGYEHWGYAIGLLHDAGKTSFDFQRRLAGDPIHVDHSSAGAQICVARYGGESVRRVISTLMSLAIVGHHGGMPNVRAAGKRTSLDDRLSKPLPAYQPAYDNILSGSGLRLPDIQQLEKLPPLREERNLPAGIHDKGIQAIASCSSYSCQLLGRLLYSCLVDADYLDTELFMSPEVSALRMRNYKSLSELLNQLERHMQHLEQHASDTLVNRARAQIFADCVEAADWESGLFTLSVPTGGGKTLSSMQFALRHAVLHGKSRVIYAVPFTTVADQTAAVFRAIFGSENVLEHHSAHALASHDDMSEDTSPDQTKSERLAMQNWDAPIIITTNVQLLESCYANTPSKCRKLHNVAGSVIVLDEAQSLPDSLLKPTLALLEDLCIDFSTSVVLCTATQPALAKYWPFGSSPREIARHRELFDEAFMHRVRFEPFTQVSCDELVHGLSAKHQALCVVGTKKKARNLYQSMICAAKDQGQIVYDESPMDAGFFHLSTNMVAAHRMAVLNQVRKRLVEGSRCVVVSTQLIEAGVDVDFPEVYREIAGIDSLLQVAGRCNREGQQKDGQGNACEGIVHVFELEEDREAADGSLLRTWLGAMKSISKGLLANTDGIVRESLVEPFFLRRYEKDSDGLDRGLLFQSISKILESYCQGLAYESYAREYKIIDDQTEAIYVAWDDEGCRLLESARSLAPLGEAGSLFLPLQQYAVGVYPQILNQLEHNGDVEKVGDYYLLVQDGLMSRYSNEIGLLPVGQSEPNDLII